MKKLNKKIRSNNNFELKEKSINSECSIKRIIKKNTNSNTYNKNSNTIDFNLETKKNNNNNKNNKNITNHIYKLIQTKLNNSKKIINIDSKVIFNIRKNKIINDCDNKKHYIKNNKIIKSKYYNDDNQNVGWYIKTNINRIQKK